MHQTRYQKLPKNIQKNTFWRRSSELGIALLCYFLPSLLTLCQVVDPHASKLYFVANRFLLPESLVLLSISVDLKEILKLGPKALIMFLTGTAGVIIGGPLAIFIVSVLNPHLVGGEGPDAVWLNQPLKEEKNSKAPAKKE